VTSRNQQTVVQRQWANGLRWKKAAIFGGTLGILSLPSLGQAQDLNYNLYEGLFGETVTMSATGKPERLSDTPVLMDVITSDDIKRSGARDIPTLLSRLEGIAVSHNSTSSVAVAIRGYLGNTVSRVMVLINGREVYFDGFNDVYWSTLPVELEEIRQIEVIKGPQSALYGANAVDGVINIITFNPIDDDVTYARLRGGSQSLREGAVSVTQPIGDLAAIRVTAGYDHNDDTGQVLTSSTDANYAKNPTRRSLSINAALNLSEQSRIGFEASHSDISERSVNSVFFYDDRTVVDSVKANYTIDGAFGRIDAMANYTAIIVPWAQSSGFPDFAVSDHVMVGQVSDLFKLGPNDSFRLGIEGKRSTADAGVVTDGTVHEDLFAGSAMWEHRFSKSLSLVNAVRFDYFSLNRTGATQPYDIYSNADYHRSLEGLSSNSALIYKVGSEDSLRVSFARGLKFPSLDQLDEHQLSPPHVLPGFNFLIAADSFGNPNLLPSAVYEGQAGWQHRLTDWGVVCDLDIYHSVTTRQINDELYRLAPVPIVLYENVPGSLANGVELKIAHKAKEGWTWGMNYSFERVSDHADLGLASAQPVHRLNANLGYAWSQWELDINASFASAQSAKIVNSLFPAVPQQERLTSYEILAPRLAWHATDNLLIEASSQNLWSYQDSTAQKTSPNGYLTVRYSY
jgi:iron complex outermembrane receptor protein